MAAQASGRRVLVLGASSTIGMAVCRRYLDAGYAVLAHYNRSSVEVDDLAAAESGVETIACDLSDLAAVQALATSDSARACDALVCLAAIATPSSLESIEVDELTRALNVGALANYVVMGSLGPAMARRGFGRIVIGSSIGVKFGGGADSFAYALANHASEFIPRSAREWAADDVLTNVVRIGFTDTSLHAAFPGRDREQRAQMVPMRRAARADEIAGFLFWHGSESNTYVTGQVAAISGGE